LPSPSCSRRRRVTRSWARSGSVGGSARIAGGQRRREPLEQIAARLRRLRAELEATDAARGLTAKKHRVTAIRGAYLDTLSVACRRLDVSPPAGRDQAPLADIYRVEAALRERGVDVRDTVRR
jgi:hypothetical protein